MQHATAVGTPLKELLLFGLFSVMSVFGQTKAGGLGPAEIYKKVEASVMTIEAVDSAGKVAKSGSGFLVGSDGIFLTNYHVVSHVKRATVRLANGDAYDTVEVIAVDKRKDIALLKIRALELPYLTLGRSAAVEIGDTVYSVSNPLGAMLQNTLSQGLVSGKREMDGYRVFQISAPISHGSSGGPIFNTAAEVVGIAAFMLEGGQNLNFAIPIDYARGMLAAANPQPLSSIYEPEGSVGQPSAVQIDVPNGAQQQPTSSDVAEPSRTKAGNKIPEEMRQQSSIFLEKWINRWTDADAREVLGEPLRHRFAYDQNKTITGDVFAFADPTGLYRQFELIFDTKTKRFTNLFVYPWNMTWEQCKQSWGDKVKVIRNQDGTRFYSYTNRRIHVLVAKDGKVLNFGIY